jgi:hypothetical protein
LTITRAPAAAATIASASSRNSAPLSVFARSCSQEAPPRTQAAASATGSTPRARQSPVSMMG